MHQKNKCTFFSLKNFFSDKTNNRYCIFNPVVSNYMKNPKVFLKQINRQLDKTYAQEFPLA